jgi:hypothetical protein
MLRQAAADAAQQWKLGESSARERLVTLTFSFCDSAGKSEVAPQTVFPSSTGFEIRQKPEAPLLNQLRRVRTGKTRPELVISRI